MGFFGADGVGKSFFVYRYKNFDISLPRVERKTGYGHTGFSAEVTDDMKEACRRRDFTINSILIRVTDLEVFDFFNGVEDLRQKTIRMTDQNSFGDDSLRVLRGMQFAARFGFRIDKKTVDICLRIPLDDISKSRIFAEFEKMFSGDYPWIGLYYFFKLGIAEKIFCFRIAFIQFLGLCKELRCAYAFFGSKKGLFLFILLSSRFVKKEHFLDKISAPKEYRKIIAANTEIPKKISERFLAGIAVRTPVSEWLGSYKKGVADGSKKLHLYDGVFVCETAYETVIKEGFVSGAIGSEYRRRRAEEIRKKYSKRIVCIK